MNVTTQRSHALTLIEIIISITLLSVLMGVIVISAANWLEADTRRDTSYRLESLLALARADATGESRRIRLLFPDESTGSIEVLIESDPLQSPGEFIPYTATWEQLTVYQDGTFTRIELTENQSWDNARSLDNEQTSTSHPALTFYPNGNSDSAIIEWTQNDTDNPLIVRLQLNGTTGQIDTEMHSITSYEMQYGITPQGVIE